MAALWNAFKRLIAGLLGIWCIVGLPVVFYAWNDPNMGGAILAVLFFIAFCYGAVIWKIWKQGRVYLKWLAINVAICMALAVIVGVLGGIVAIFTGIEIYRESRFTIGGIVAGLWLIELLQKHRTETAER